jgi:hypothetical protein
VNRPAPRSDPAGAGTGDTLLRITDGRTHHRVEIPTAGPRVLRICTHLACSGLEVGPTDLRALLVGDVLLRTVEANGGQVVHVAARPELPPEQSEALERATAALGIHPPAAWVSTDQLDAALGDRADLHVFGDARRDSAEQGVRVETARVQHAAAVRRWHGDGPEGRDALALRLALLEHGYRSPVRLSVAVLADAEHRLAAWRGRVAGWAHSPSRPVPDPIRRQARIAIADDLGTPGVLALLRRIDHADDIPEGAKFESFALLDRVLGLELIRDVGRI